MEVYGWSGDGVVVAWLILACTAALVGRRLCSGPFGWFLWVRWLCEGLVIPRLMF